MSGLLGIGCDILKLSPQEKAIVKKKVEVYKTIRPLVKQGTLYRLVFPLENNRCVLQNNSENKDLAVVFCYNWHCT